MRQTEIQHHVRGQVSVSEPLLDNLTVFECLKCLICVRVIPFSSLRVSSSSSRLLHDHMSVLLPGLLIETVVEVVAHVIVIVIQPRFPFIVI